MIPIRSVTSLRPCHRGLHASIDRGCPAVASAGGCVRPPAVACFPLSQHPGSSGFTRPSITTDQAATLPRTTPAPTLDSAGIFHREYLLVTLGACALVFLAAFESLAVTTIMPLVSRELDGAALYALAFAGPLATGVIGMVAAGNWSDRRPPCR